MGQRRHFFGAALPDPNTFIGGVGATSLTSETDFVDFTQNALGESKLVEADIKNFQIDGSNNVSFFIDVNYAFGTANVMLNDAALTYYIDVNAHLVGFTGSTGCLSGANVTHVYVPGFFDISDGRSLGNNTPKLVKGTSGFDVGSWGGGHIWRLSKITRMINMTGGWAQTNNAFYAYEQLSFLERAYIPLVATTNLLLENQMIDTGSNQKFFRDVKLNCKIYHNDGLSAKDRLSFNTISGTVVGNPGHEVEVNGLIYLAVDGAPMADGEFQVDVGNNGNALNNLRDAINADTRVGTIPDAVTAVRIQVIILRSTMTGATANTITASSADIFVLTALFEGGTDIDPMLIYLRDSRSATLIEVGTPISVNAPTSLSHSNLTSTTVDLDFTEPSPNANGTDAFDVWVDDGTVYRKYFFFAEIGATGDTLDLQEVFDDVGSLSGVKIKVRTIDGEMNFSSFSNEITLP